MSHRNVHPGSFSEINCFSDKGSVLCAICLKQYYFNLLKYLFILKITFRTMHTLNHFNFVLLLLIKPRLWLHVPFKSPWQHISLHCHARTSSFWNFKCNIFFAKTSLKCGRKFRGFGFGSCMLLVNNGF